jgi:hypothetical protein
MTAEELETPVTARNRCRQVGSMLAAAELGLKRARDAEVEAEHVYQQAHRRALLMPDCPRPRRGENGVTVADRDGWVDEQCDASEFAYKLATAARLAAKDHYETVNTQAMLAQAILKSIDRAVAIGTGHDQ